MRTLRRFFLLAATAFCVTHLRANTHYVDLNSASPTPPYSDWSNAATNIQNAIDISTDGDLVIVTNGIYDEGGRVAASMTNRVAVDKAILVQSVNGPAVTLIVGYQVPTVASGGSAIRCAYLTNGASLTGFTLTNGVTYLGGSRGGIYCESATAVISNCLINGNVASSGGGVYRGTLLNCTLLGNSAGSGGAAYTSTLFDSVLGLNSGVFGGGAYSSTLINCTITNNQAMRAVNAVGGGVYQSNLTNCIVSSNLAREGGGGYFSTFDGCSVIGNAATNSGGGGSSVTFIGCTITGNSAVLTHGKMLPKARAIRASLPHD